MEATQAELAVLRALWAVGVATIRDLRDELYPEGQTSEYATVQKLLERLEAKGLVERDRSATPHRFAAAVDRDAFLGRRLADLADALCDGSLTPLMTQLVQHERLDARQRKELRALLGQITEPAGSGRRAPTRTPAPGPTSLPKRGAKGRKS